MKLLEEHASELQIIAGGTDLIPSLKQRLFAPKYVMYIRGIGAMRGIGAVPGAGVGIGALTTPEYRREMVRVFAKRAAIAAGKT